uniref:NADH-ubiquinone oxidoreductase chain 4 n=1 Tax=Protankyra bidentata TaxID=2904677 RepID=A0AAU7E6L9_9ECHN
MLGVFLGYFFCLLSLFFINSRLLFSLVSIGCCFLTFFSLLFFSNNSGHIITPFFICDNVSYPLLVLSSLIVFVSVLASWKLIFSSNSVNSMGYHICLLVVGGLLYPCFLINSYFGYFIFFEASVIPLLILITRWGSQKERIQASLYFIFFTLVGSYPLLIFLFYFFFTFSSSMFGSELLQVSIFLPEYCYMSLFSEVDLFFFWWLAILGFLIKLPIYGFHLWLPKAHVEAPVAGSMLLAALLLKLGGYGLIRIMSILQNNIETYVIPFCFVGSLITSIICLRQVDLKSLIAYSSVGHMSLVAGGILLNTSWGVGGSLMLMIAHGLVSSCLFALANLVYERTGTRSLKITRGLSCFSFLISFWWLFTCVSNLGLPPLPNFIGEVVVIVAAVSSSSVYFIILGLSVVFSSVYSLFIYQKVCSGTLPTFLSFISHFNFRENYLIFMHLFPLVLLLGNIYLCFVW